MVKSKAERGWFFSRKKIEVVLRVLRGEDLDLVTCESGISGERVLFCFGGGELVLSCGFTKKMLETPVEDNKDPSPYKRMLF